MTPCKKPFSTIRGRILLSDAYYSLHSEMEEEMKAYGVPTAIAKPALDKLADSMFVGLEQMSRGSLDEDNRDIFSWVLARYIDKLHTEVYLDEAAIETYRSFDTTDMPDIIETQLAAARRHRRAAEAAEEMLNALM